VLKSCRISVRAIFQAVGRRLHTTEAVVVAHSGASGGRDEQIRTWGVSLRTTIDQCSLPSSGRWMHLRLQCEWSLVLEIPYFILSGR
jgi:hypothetical protein